MKYMNVGTSKLNIGSRKVESGQVFEAEGVPAFLIEVGAVELVREGTLAEEPEGKAVADFVIDEGGAEIEVHPGETVEIQPPARRKKGKE